MWRNAGAATVTTAYGAQSRSKSLWVTGSTASTISCEKLSSSRPAGPARNTCCTASRISGFPTCPARSICTPPLRNTMPSTQSRPKTYRGDSCHVPAPQKMRPGIITQASKSTPSRSGMTPRTNAQRIEYCIPRAHHRAIARMMDVMSCAPAYRARRRAEAPST